MNTDPDELRLGFVARSLVGLTSRNKIEWDKDSLNDTSYSYSTTDTTIVVYSTDGDGQLPFAILVRDRDGDTVATLTTATSNVETRDAIRDLYHLARRSALRVDTVLDHLIESLGIEEAEGE